MQSVVSLDTADIYTDKKRPSAKLQEKIKSCVSAFKSLGESVQELIELGKSEGFSLAQISQFVRQEMLKAEIPPRTITRYLPAELKRNYKSRIDNSKSNNNLAKMAKLPEPTKPLKSTKEFVFIGHLSKTSKNRLAVAFPATETKNLQKFIGKKIKVILTECD